MDRSFIRKGQGLEEDLGLSPSFVICKVCDLKKVTLLVPSFLLCKVGMVVSEKYDNAMKGFCKCQVLFRLL